MDVQFAWFFFHNFTMPLNNVYVLEPIHRKFANKSQSLWKSEFYSSKHVQYFKDDVYGRLLYQFKKLSRLS